MDDGSIALATLVLWGLVGVGAAWDVAQRRIPNPLVLTGLLLGLAFGLRDGGLPGLGAAFLGIATAFAILILPFHFRRVGGGDVKLAMVCGAFTGWAGAVHIILVGAVVHGLLALLFLLARHASERVGFALLSDFRVPHGVGFAVAAVLYTTRIVVLW